MTSGRPSDSRKPRDLLVADLDPATRGGWLLKTSRLLARDGSPPLAVIAGLTDVSPPTLSRLENGKGRRGDVIDAYELALGLPPGRLRGATDILYRTFPRGRRDSAPKIAVAGVREMSALTERLLAHVEEPLSGAATSGDWLTWARALDEHGGLGLPEPQAARLCAQLVSDTSRATGPAHAPCYEALARMVGGAYGDTAVAAIEAWLMDPDVQVLYAVFSAACETFSPRAISLVQRMLLDPRDHVKIGAARGIENLAQIDPTGAFWSVVAQDVIRQLEVAPAGSPLRKELSHLVRIMPGSVKVSFGADGLALEPVPPIPQWIKSGSNSHWSLMTRMADKINDDLGLEIDDTLPELLFDIFLGPHHTRGVTATLLVNAVPEVASRAIDYGAELADTHPDASIRRRATEGVGSSLARVLPARVARWLVEGSDERREWALLAAGAAGQGGPVDQVERLLAAGGFPARRALYCAGMSRSPHLATWRDDLALPAELRGAAAWWLRVGGVMHD